VELRGIPGDLELDHLLRITPPIGSLSALDGARRAHYDSYLVIFNNLAPEQNA
jgi:hypothetical protein